MIHDEVMRFRLIILIISLSLLMMFGCSRQSQHNFNQFEEPIVEPEDSEQSPSKTIHSGDLIIEGTDVYLIENENYFQQGNIYINDNATLIIKDSQFELGRGDVPTIHTYFFVEEGASLEIENSTISPKKVSSDEMGPLVIIRNSGNVQIIDSPTQIHLLEMYENSHLTMINSEMIFEIGGLLQISGGNSELINSTIASLGLQVPADATIEIDGLHSGICYDVWDVHEMIPSADYSLTMENSCILEDTFTGEYEHGPYERGWIFFLDPSAHATISNSEFRKIFMEIIDDSATFENLKMDTPSNLEYNSITLTDIAMKGQWPFWVENSNLTLINSEYLFLQPTGNSTIYLKDSHLVEFIPRDFFGEVIFENGLWTNAGEIIGGVPYHSEANDFLIRGSLHISDEVKDHLQFKNATVTREYTVLLKDDTDHPIQGALIKINGKEFETDETGQVLFELIFNESTYNQPQELDVIVDSIILYQEDIDFFTETPIIFS